MGILNDAASIISARNSQSKRSKSRRSSRQHQSSSSSSSRRDRDRDRGRERGRDKIKSRSSSSSSSSSRSRSRSRRRRSSRPSGSSFSNRRGGLSGLAATLFGGGGGGGNKSTDDEIDEALSSIGADNYYHDHDHPRAAPRQVESSSSKALFSSGSGSSSFFSSFGGRSTPGPSYYRRSPRRGFMARQLRKLRRLLRDLAYYAQRHPVRVFVLAVMPLLTGGALTALLARFGIRLPAAVERMLEMLARMSGVGAGAGAGFGIGGAANPLGLVVGEAMRMVQGAELGSRLRKISKALS